MKMSNYIDKYLLDKTYSITIKKNSINIINYLEIEDFSNTKIIVKHNYGKTTIKGKNLVVSKMQDNEILIIGQIQTIEV